MERRVRETDKDGDGAEKRQPVRGGHRMGEEEVALLVMSLVQSVCVLQPASPG